MTNLNEALLKRNNSISSNSGASDKSEAHPARKGEQGQEGQLRYWTNDMCRKSPHLFDFVITVRKDISSSPPTCEDRADRVRRCG